jgi:exopolysaccharide production protein ExoQ
VISNLILIGACALFWWLIRRDNRLREGVSTALWIPTLWVGILASRPLSMWVGFGGGSDTQGGSPVDSLFFLVMIIAALRVLVRRQVAWSRIITENWAIFLFYGFLLLSVAWSPYSFVSFKRWFKEFGNILVLLVILTEINPQQALRTVFFRCGCVLIPLSEIYLRWFPNLGRVYSSHSGGLEVTGVTCQKNSLGALVLVCSLIILWDWLELRRRNKEQPELKLRWDLRLRVGLLLCGAHLLHACDSKTSMTCLVLGAGFIAASRLPLLRRNLRFLGVLALAGFLGYQTLDQMFDFRKVVLHGLGRNSDLTGRTEVWRVLWAAGTDPVFGTGFMSFWDNPEYQSKLPEADAVSAHNGYLEIYLFDGMIGVFFLGLMIVASGARINKALAWDGDYGVVRFAVFLVALLANYTESNFACMTPVGFLFLTAAIGQAEAASVFRLVPNPTEQSSVSEEAEIPIGGSTPSFHH